MYRKILVVICSVFSLFPLFSQTVSFDKRVQNFADGLSPNLPLVAGMGLNWSTPYVGRLIGYPVHFGVGISAGSVFMDNAVMLALGINEDASATQDKQWLPGYVIAARMGGLDNIPFDIGVKFGYLPDMPLGEFSYNNTIVGLDIHYALHVPRNNGPSFALGLGFDRLDGGINGSTTAIPNGVPNVTLDMPVDITWASTTVKFQAFLSQKLLATSFSLFGNLDAGYSMNNVSVKIGEKGNIVAKHSADVSSLALQIALGLSCELNVFRIDASLMWNLINFGTGVSFGFRYQQ
jgi:hypothetical protein